MYDFTTLGAIIGMALAIILMTLRDGDKGTFLENVPLTPSPRVILLKK